MQAFGVQNIEAIRHSYRYSPAFSADASDLGLAVGQWPEALEYEGVRFEKDEAWALEGDLRYVDYWSGEATFRVYND